MVGQIENSDVLEVFNERVQSHLHIMLSFSEIGKTFS